MGEKELHKKIIFYGAIFFLLLSMMMPVTCLAGDIPESLLYDENCPVYFGEVKSVDGESITIIQVQNIKGDFAEDSVITYPRFTFTKDPKAGQIYLCGYFDENNPLYIWEVDCYDTGSLKISNTDDMSKRMQGYLNEGLFEEAEAKRTAGLEAEAARIRELEEAMEEAAAAGTAMMENITNSGAVAVVGGADGPTAIFLAGRLDTGLFITVGAGILLAGILLTAAIAAVFFNRKNK